MHRGRSRTFLAILLLIVPLLLWAQGTKLDDAQMKRFIKSSLEEVANLSLPMSAISITANEQGQRFMLINFVTRRSTAVENLQVLYSTMATAAKYAQTPVEILMVDMSVEHMGEEEAIFAAPLDKVLEWQESKITWQQLVEKHMIIRR